MKTIRILLTLIAVAAMVKASAKDLPSINCLIQVKNFSSKFESPVKRAAFEKICVYYASSTFSKEMLLEYSNMIAQTQNNLDVISYSAELASKAGSNSELFLGIAKLAANSDTSNPFLMEILNITYENIRIQKLH